MLQNRSGVAATALDTVAYLVPFSLPYSYSSVCFHGKFGGKFKKSCIRSCPRTGKLDIRISVMKKSVRIKNRTKTFI